MSSQRQQRATVTVKADPRASVGTVIHIIQQLIWNQSVLINRVDFFFFKCSDMFLQLGCLWLFVLWLLLRWSVQTDLPESTLVPSCCVFNKPSPLPPLTGETSAGLLRVQLLRKKRKHKFDSRLSPSRANRCFAAEPGLNLLSPLVPVLVWEVTSVQLKVRANYFFVSGRRVSFIIRNFPRRLIAACCRRLVWQIRLSSVWAKYRASTVPAFSKITPTQNIWRPLAPSDGHHAHKSHCGIQSDQSAVWRLLLSNRQYFRRYNHLF